MCCAVLSCLVMSDFFATPWTVAHSVHWDSPGKNTGVGSHSLLQGILPTQESNPGLLPCRQILYFVTHGESPETFTKTNSKSGTNPE